jgi:hypothetical protein
VEIISKTQLQAPGLGDEDRNASPVTNIVERQNAPIARPGSHDKKRPRDQIDRASVT